MRNVRSQIQAFSVQDWSESVIINGGAGFMPSVSHATLFDAGDEPYHTQMVYPHKGHPERVDQNEV